jgi:hypothetical protein
MIELKCYPPHPVRKMAKNKRRYFIVNNKIPSYDNNGCRRQVILSPSKIRVLSPTSPVSLIFEGIYLHTGRI